MPKYDLESMEHVAGRIEAIHQDFKASKTQMTGVTGENPFGTIKHPEGTPEHPHPESPSEHASNAIGGFKDRMHGEFDAGAQLMLDTGSALREAMRLIREREAAGEDSLTVKDQGNLPA